jgi:hypothetical protein
MYTYDTLEELVTILDKHFKNTERFHFNYYIKDHKFYYTFTVDNEIVLEGNLTLDNASIRPYDLPDECHDWFINQWYNFRRSDTPLPSETGENITLSDHVIVTDPCYNIDTWCNGQLTDVKPGKYHTKATYANINGWGRRCTSLILWHESISEPESKDYEHTDITVGVDSGQAGVIDFPYFETLEKDNDRKKQWYDNIQTFENVRRPISENIVSIIHEGKKLHEQASKALDNYFETKKNDNSQSAAKFFTKYHEFDHKLEKLLRDNGLDKQSLIDHKTTPMFAYKLWTDEHSAVTGSGFGDGSYDCFIAKDGDQIVGIKLDYFYYEDED